MAGLALQDVEERESRTELTGRTNWNPGNGGCPRLLAARVGTVEQSLGAGPGERRAYTKIACSLRETADRGAVGLAVLTPPAVMDRVRAGMRSRVCTARSPR